MTRWKPLPWVLVGVALLAVSLVAARINSPSPSASGEKPAPSTSTTGVNGLTVVGTVGTTPEVFPIFPPGVPAMASLTVKKVLVKDGATVHPGDVLIEFDSSTVVERKTQAEHAVTAAEWVAAQSSKKVQLHSLVIDKAKLGVRKAEEDLVAAEKAQKAVSDTLEENLNLPAPGSTTPLTEAQKEVRRNRSQELLTANAVLARAKTAVEAAKIDLKQAEESAPLLEWDVQAANAKVAALKGQLSEATAVIETFKLKAQVAGTIEQINNLAEGVSVGPTTRTPLMYLIPSGPRVVRAEVEAEFAHKIDAFVGKTVTVKAGEKFNDTYTGVARRVSGAFLPKRYGSDSLVTNPTRVLECLIEVTDWAPAGKPPLRPGQPVRVEFGQ